MVKPPIERLINRILVIHGRKVTLDADLAELYGVPTKVLNQAVKRHADRFPPDFLFRLTVSERREVVTICDHLSRLRFSHSPPPAFTEHGALMAAGVLNTVRAVEVSIFIVRAFVKLRGMLSANRLWHRRVLELERRVGGHDGAIRSLVVAIRDMIDPRDAAPRERIGFHGRGTKTE